MSINAAGLSPPPYAPPPQTQIPATETAPVPPTQPPQVALRLDLPAATPSLFGVGLSTSISVADLAGLINPAFMKRLRGLASGPLDDKAAVKVGIFVAAPPDPAKLNRAGIFISLTLPGQSTSWIMTLSPGQQSVKFGRGKSWAGAGGNVVGMANVYGGAAELGNLGRGASPQGQANGLVAAIFKVPGSKSLMKFLAGTIDAGLLAAQVGVTVGGDDAGLPAGAAVQTLRALWKRVGSSAVANVAFYIGPAWGVGVAFDGRDQWSVSQDGKTKSFEQFVQVKARELTGPDAVKQAAQDLFALRALYPRYNDMRRDPEGRRLGRTEKGDRVYARFLEYRAELLRKNPLLLRDQDGVMVADPAVERAARLLSKRERDEAVQFLHARLRLPVTTSAQPAAPPASGQAT